MNGATIYVRDVAQVRDGYQPQQNVVRKDGVRGVLVTIMKSGIASTLEVVRRVKEEVPKVMSTLPRRSRGEGVFRSVALRARGRSSGVLARGRRSPRR